MARFLVLGRMIMERREVKSRFRILKEMKKSTMKNLVGFGVIRGIITFRTMIVNGRWSKRLQEMPRIRHSANIVWHLFMVMMMVGMSMWPSSIPMEKRLRSLARRLSMIIVVCTLIPSRAGIRKLNRWDNILWLIRPSLIANLPSILSSLSWMMKLSLLKSIMPVPKLRRWRSRQRRRRLRIIVPMSSRIGKMIGAEKE